MKTIEQILEKKVEVIIYEGEFFHILMKSIKAIRMRLLGDIEEAKIIEFEKTIFVESLRSESPKKNLYGIPFSIEEKKEIILNSKTNYLEFIKYLKKYVEIQQHSSC